jgi:serine/threonine-protein kinase
MRPPLLSAGFRVDRYLLLQHLGSGGSGAVYRALDTLRGGHVALKIRQLPPGGPAPRERFVREARAAGEVQHPSVVRVFGYGVEQDRSATGQGDLAFLAMELVEGETLADLLSRDGPLGVRRAIEILLPVFAAVAEIHACGVVHRDIKPANVLLEAASLEGGGLEGGIKKEGIKKGGVKKGGVKTPPRAKLADFGLSRFVEEFSSVTESGVTLGTPQYMAPEVTRYAYEADELSDQYALGVVLYECVTGIKPFRGETAYELMHAVVSGALAAPSEIAAGLPPGFDSVVLRAMSRQPDERFDSVLDFADALLPFMSEGIGDGAGAGTGAGKGVGAGTGERLHPQVDPAFDRPSGERRIASPVEILVNDGIAVALHGDTFVAVWQAAARMDLIVWQFDIAERFAPTFPDGIVALIVLLPSSAPPDAATSLECVRRMKRVGPMTRRQANVAVGGGVWQSVVHSVVSVLARHMLARSARLTFSATLEDAIQRLREKASADTPSAEVLEDDVHRLYRALGVESLP